MATMGDTLKIYGNEHEKKYQSSFTWQCNHTNNAMQTNDIFSCCTFSA